ncbi:MAG: homoserine O-acetyltransferase [Rickettsiales bacterium]|nr:homoserine O-acetyltransferase [Rickettsiales bacterium]
MKIKALFGPKYTEYEIGDVVFLAQEKPLKLSSGYEISNFPLAYQTYGELNREKSNAILICHALTGDQYVASSNPISGKAGWWLSMVGPDKSIDTNKFFVICSNVLGGCMGSFGPKSVNEKTNHPYGLDFPMVTIDDMVRAQNLLIEHFGIKKLHAVIGGSMGGMQVLSWSVLYPEKVNLVIPLSTSYHHSPQNIAFHEVGRQAIFSDQAWSDGKYLEQKTYPAKGLALARMTAHITYLSKSALQKKFGRNLQNKEQLSYSLSSDFQVENYLHHQGATFIDRFDPNSYLYITKAVDYFDLESDSQGVLSKAFKSTLSNKTIKFCIISFSDDWLFPPSESKKITQALIACGINASAVVIEGTAGHDSFLIENETLKNMITSFLKFGGTKI